MSNGGAGRMGPRRSRAAAVVTAVGLAWGVISCSETDAPLRWVDAMRAGLDEAPDTALVGELVDTLVAAERTYGPTVYSGSSGTLLIGRVERSDPFEAEVASRAYFKWDLGGLPAGTVNAARIDLVLRDLSEADPADPDSIQLQLYEVAGPWTEDSLGSVPHPEVGDALEEGLGTVDLTGLSDTSDVSLTRIFDGPGLIDLVSAWRDQPDENTGLAIEVAPGEAQEAFLRFVSSEGTPTGTAVNLSTPTLRVEIARAGGNDTTLTLEAAEDGYVVFAEDPATSGPPELPDSLLVLSTGHVQRILLDLDVRQLMTSHPDRFPVGVAVHQAVLRLTPVRDNDWSLHGEETLTVWAYETSSAWSEETDPESIVLGDVLGYDIIGAGDQVIELDVRQTVQQLIEGAQRSFVILGSGEVTQFRSVLVKGGTARVGAPELRLVWTRPGSSRLGDGEGE